MGGPGSGQYFRLDCKLTVEECFALDVNRLVRSGGIGWGSDSGTLEPTGPGPRFDYAFELRYGTEPHLTLRRNVLKGGQVRIVEMPIPLEKTSVHFGGVRWWFNCPECRRRCGKLYMPHGVRRFACRVCHNLNYGCQQENAACRALRRAQNLRHRLGGDGSDCYAYTRPKGMHRRTFERLLKQVRAADRAAWAASDGCW